MAVRWNQNIRTRRGPVTAVLVAVSMLFLAFQNCSGGEGEGVASPGPKVVEGAPVSVIDQVAGLSAWKLSSPKVEVGTAVDQIAVLGRCDGQEDARLEWRVDDVSGAEFSGEAHCVNGEFQLDLKPLTGLPCGHRNHIVGRHGAESGALAEVIRRCEPEAVKVVDSLKDVLTPEALKSETAHCQVEVSAASGCHHVCYSEDGRVVHEAELSGAICGP